MTELLAAAIIERDLRMAKYPDQVRARKIGLEEAEADAKAWAAIAWRLGAPCEPQGDVRQIGKGGTVAHPPHWFGARVFWAHWFAGGRAVDDFSPAELVEATERALRRREADLAARPGDAIKQARRDATAQIHALLAAEAAELAILNARFRAQAETARAAA